MNTIPSYRSTVQPQDRHISPARIAAVAPTLDGEGECEFAEPVPEYLRPGYRALMAGNGFEAIQLWETLYERYPSAEVCGHLARAHYYQTFFLGHSPDHPQHGAHIRQMQLWAERALLLNPNSSIGHAMLAGAIGREAMLSGSQKQIILSAWKIRHHAEYAILIDNHWTGHFVLGSWHRELASINPGIRALAQLFFVQVPSGSYAKSLEHFQEILKQYPENNTIYAEMAYTYEQMGDIRYACELLQRAVSMPLFRHPIASHLTCIARTRLERLEKRR